MKRELLTYSDVRIFYTRFNDLSANLSLEVLHTMDYLEDMNDMLEDKEYYFDQKSLYSQTDNLTLLRSAARKYNDLLHYLVEKTGVFSLMTARMCEALPREAEALFGDLQKGDYLSSKEGGES